MESPFLSFPINCAYSKNSLSSIALSYKYEASCTLQKSSFLIHFWRFADLISFFILSYGSPESRSRGIASLTIKFGIIGFVTLPKHVILWSWQHFNEQLDGKTLNMTTGNVCFSGRIYLNLLAWKAIRTLVLRIFGLTTDTALRYR